MIANNRPIIERVVRFIDDFVAARIEIEDVQRQLDSCLGLLEGRPQEIMKELRWAEADLERIRFTTLLDEQRPSAIFRLDSLREALQAALEDEDDSPYAP